MVEVTNREVDGELHNAVFMNGVCVGEIYNDRKGRFVDGTRVSTSKIIHQDGNIITTRNSIYRVVMQ